MLSLFSMFHVKQCISSHTANIRRRILRTGVRFDMFHVKHYASRERRTQNDCVLFHVEHFLQRAHIRL